MKIAFITESFPELSETFILGKAVALQRRGHEVTVFTQFKRDYQVHPDLIAGLDLKRQVIRLPAWDRVRGKDVVRALAGCGFCPEAVLRAGKAAFAKGKDKPGLLWVKSLPFLCCPFDLLHAHYAYMGRRFLDVARALRIPLVVSFLGTDASLDLAEEPGAYQPLFREAAGFIAVTEFLRQKAVENGCPAEKITVIPTEGDTDFFHFVDRRGRRAERPVILTVARLDWTKGHLYALEAMVRLKAEGVAFRYQIVGGGRERKAVELAIHDYGLADCVELLGPQDREGVRAAMARADVFMLASVIEGIAGVLLEAMATGLPVVATRVGGVAEVVKEGETGFLVPSRNPAALAERVKHLLESPEERWHLGERGRQWVEKNFAPSLLLDRLEDFYARVHRGKISA